MGHPVNSNSIEPERGIARSIRLKGEEKDMTLGLQVETYF